nr:immunoglobulin heavy chain junction region [Macaca mulatta]
CARECSGTYCYWSSDVW